MDARKKQSSALTRQMNISQILGRKRRSIRNEFDWSPKSKAAELFGLY
jgi:hypothetical protein